MSAIDSNSILCQRDGDVTVLKLNRPDKYNSFNREMALALQEKLKVCANDGTRCVVLTGEGKAFCAGQDLQEVVAMDGPSLEKILSEHYNPIIRILRDLELPVIAAVNGPAAGAGANIALACDIVIARESSYFLQAFCHIGLMPDSGGTYFLPRLIGWQKASALMMLGEKVSAADAEKMGMIYKSIPDAEWDETVSSLAKRMAAMPTRGLALTKRALNSSMYNDMLDQLEVELHMQTAAGRTADYKEGVAAFLEKRKPVFTGQ